MLATTLRASLAASLLSLSGMSLAGTAQAQIPVRPPETEPVFQPYGNVVGAWQSGSLLQEGIVSGALTDGSGMPLWMMTATLDEVGKIQGSLVPMLYSGNPVIGMGELGLVGSAKLDASGSGSFTMVVHEMQKLLPASDGDDPIYALGFLSGELQNGRLTGSSKSQSAGASAAEQRERALIGLPGGVIQNLDVGGVQMDGASSAGKRDQASIGLPGGVIEDPHASDLQLDGMSSAGQYGQASIGLPGGVIEDVLASGIQLEGISSAGSRDQASIGLPGGVIEDPLSDDMSIDAPASGSGASAGGYDFAIPPIPGQKSDRSAARRGLVVDQGPSSEAGPSISGTQGRSAGSHQIPVSGSGKLVGSWTWLTF